MSEKRLAEVRIADELFEGQARRQVRILAGEEELRAFRVHDVARAVGPQPRDRLHQARLAGPVLAAHVRPLSGTDVDFRHRQERLGVLAPVVERHVLQRDAEARVLRQVAERVNAGLAVELLLVARRLRSLAPLRSGGRRSPSGSRSPASPG